MEELRTAFNNIASGFPDYQDKMNKLANAHEAEAYYLGRVGMWAEIVSDECQVVADNINDVKYNLTR